jgi:hypothetical protein
VRGTDERPETNKETGYMANNNGVVSCVVSPHAVLLVPRVLNIPTRMGKYVRRNHAKNLKCARML